MLFFTVFAFPASYRGQRHDPRGKRRRPTWTAVKIKIGPTTTTNKTITEPDGSVEHQKIITTDRGEFDSTTTTITTRPDGSIQRSSSATNVIRVQPPSS